MYFFFILSQPKHPQNQPIRNNNKNSFANLVPELFETTNIRATNNSNEINESILLNETDNSLLQLNQSHQNILLKTKQNELEQVRELLGEMRAKNSILSSEKQSIEMKLREMEVKTRGFEAICGERERELEEKERQIAEMSVQSRSEVQDFIRLKKEVGDLKAQNDSLQAGKVIMMSGINNKLNSSSFMNSSEELMAGKLIKCLIGRIFTYNPF